MTPLIPNVHAGPQLRSFAHSRGGLALPRGRGHCEPVAQDKLIEARSHYQRECFEAGLLFARTEGIVPAPEANHGIATVIQEANRAKEEGRSQTILFNLCGHGNFDMAAYEAYLSGKLVDEEVTTAQIERSLAEIDHLQV
jgi:tryptophan synthase beta chain